MSRAFVKEDAPEPDDVPPERPVSSQPNYVTPRGLKSLEDWEGKLVEELAAFGGAQEQPAKRKRKRELERDLRYARARLETAIPVDPAAQPRDQIRFGAAVVLKRDDGVEKRLRITGEDEAEEGGEFIGWASPFAQALFGLKAGQTFSWETETGTHAWSVVSISYSSDSPGESPAVREDGPESRA